MYVAKETATVLGLFHFSEKTAIAMIKTEINLLIPSWRKLSTFDVSVSPLSF